MTLIIMFYRSLLHFSKPTITCYLRMALVKQIEISVVKGDMLLKYVSKFIQCQADIDNLLEVGNKGAGL